MDDEELIYSRRGTEMLLPIVTDEDVSEPVRRELAAAMAENCLSGVKETLLLMYESSADKEEKKWIITVLSDSTEYRGRFDRIILNETDTDLRGMLADWFADNPMLSTSGCVSETANLRLLFSRETDLSTKNALAKAIQSCSFEFADKFLFHAYESASDPEEKRRIISVMNNWYFYLENYSDLLLNLLLTEPDADLQRLLAQRFIAGPYSWEGECAEGISRVRELFDQETNIRTKIALAGVVRVCDDEYQEEWLEEMDDKCERNEGEDSVICTECERVYYNN